MGAASRDAARAGPWPVRLPPLAALFPQVNSLGETAERLIQSHPEAAEDLQEKCTELNQAWSSLGKRADQRKAKLGDSHDRQRLLSDSR